MKTRLLGIVGLMVSLTLAIPAGNIYAQGEADTEVSNSCIECHLQLKDERLSQPVELWSESVHAEVGNTCEGCHKGDPKDPTVNAMSKANQFTAAPKPENITAFCGKCHQELSENFLTSAHGEMGEPTCIDCHHTHDILRISLEIINPEKCGACHDDDSPDKLKNVLHNLHQNFKAAKTNLKNIQGFPTGTLEKELDDIWHRLRQVRMVSHTFDLDRIRLDAEKVNASLENITEEIGRLTEESLSRQRWGYAIVFSFLALALLLYFYNRTEQE